MSKRSWILMAAFGLLASLAFGTPSQAGMVNVSLGFAAYNNTPFDNTISQVEFQFSGLDGITGASFSGSALANSPLASAAVTVTPDAGAETVTLTFAPTSIFNVTGTLSFDTTQTPSSITLTSMTVVASADVQTHTPLLVTTLAVPEPTSMGLLGIGMAGFFAFRRLSRKRATKV